MFNYKHTLKHLGVKYVFPAILDSWATGRWCEQPRRPSKDSCGGTTPSKLRRSYHVANALMEKKSSVVNSLFSKETAAFFKKESHNKEDLRYLSHFLSGHFSQKRHLRVLIAELVGLSLIEAQDTPAGLGDDLKVRKIVNRKQRREWEQTVDTLSLAVEVLNAASYSADDVFDRTLSRYGTSTVYAKHGDAAGVIGADLLLHYLGNYFFYRTIRRHERGVEAAYLANGGAVSVNKNPYTLKWESKDRGVYVYINPEQYMDVWETWTWARYMINSGQIRDLYEFRLETIGKFKVESYVSRAYRLSGGFIEATAHLAAAFVGCGYWAGRQSLGRWAAIYGTIVQIRNDFFDYVIVPNPGHAITKETHEDVGLGRVTLPLGYAYSKASVLDRKKILTLAGVIAKGRPGAGGLRAKRMELNQLIAKNGGFRAAKRLVYNLVLEALREIGSLGQGFAGNAYHQQLVAWTLASLNIVNIFPEQDTQATDEVDMFDLEKVYQSLGK